MIRYILAIILAILIAPPAQPPSACLAASSDLAADVASGATCIEIPAGIYDIPATITTSTASLRGAGIGRTILRGTGASYVLKLTGTRQTVYDLSITAVVTATGAISIYTPATDATIERVEVSGPFSAFGIETYKEAISPAQGSTIRDCLIHDLPGNGLLIDSSRNLLAHNHIARVGVSTFFHGMYVQGGDNRIEGNVIEAAKGYSLHNWAYVPNLDGSGNSYRDNISLNPGLGHMVVGGSTRQTLISGNTFRGAGAGIDARTPVLVTDNTFEDVTREGVAIIGISQSAGGSVVSHNRIITKLAVPGYGARFGILLDAPAIVSGNTLDMASLPWGIVARVSKGQIIGNRVTSSVGYAWQTGIKIDAADTIVSQNVIDLPLGAAIGGSAPPATGANLCWVAGITRGC